MNLTYHDVSIKKQGKRERGCLQNEISKREKLSITELKSILWIKMMFMLLRQDLINLSDTKVPVHILTIPVIQIQAVKITRTDVKIMSPLKTLRQEKNQQLITQLKIGLWNIFQKNVSVRQKHVKEESEGGNIWIQK